MNQLRTVVGRGALLQALGVLALATGCSAGVDDTESTAASTEDAIIGGSLAVAGGHPWMVEVWNNTNPHPPAVPNPDPNTVYPDCGGTLISPEWVVTAAHCVHRVDPFTNEYLGPADPGNIFMYLGDFDRSGFGTSAEGGNWEQARFASEVHIHPNYTPSSPGHHDIALVKLNFPAVVNARVKPIAIGSQSIAANSTSIAAGWGATASQNPQVPGTEESIILKRVSLTVRTNATCGMNGSNRYLDSDELCAGDGSHGVCFGDSGGPLIRAVGSSYELIGVTSWGTNYCTGYSVFARISSHYNWIRSYVP